MTPKLSPQKKHKMMMLYYQGYSQTKIEDKLGVDQSTVSLHVAKMKTLALEKGIQVAAEEYGVAGIVEELHSLGAELKKNNLTVEESKTGLKMVLLFQKLGVKEEQYPQLLIACKRMKEDGFIAAAIKLADLEEKTRMTYEQLLDNFGAVKHNIGETEGALTAAQEKLDKVKQETVTAENKKAAALEEQQSVMKQIGVDIHRLKLVEHLATALKDAGTKDKDIETATAHLQALNKAVFDLGLFVAIIDKAKIVTSVDHGKGLIKDLEEYGGLLEARSGLKAEIKTLKTQVIGLEQQAALKGNLEVEVTKLRNEKADLEPLVANLQKQFDTAIMLQNHIFGMTSQKAGLAQSVAELNARIDKLNTDIEAGEKKVAYLAEVEAKRVNIHKDIEELQAKVERDQRRWDIFQWFLGLVRSTSPEQLKKSAKPLLGLVECLPEKTSTKDVDLLKDLMLTELTGGNLLFSLKCLTCGAHIFTDKTRPNGGYQCPNRDPFPGPPHNVIVEKSPLAVLQAAVSPEITKSPLIAKGFPARVTYVNSDKKTD